MSERAAITIRRANTNDASAIWVVRTSAIRRLCVSHYSSEDVAKWAGAETPANFREVINETDFLVAEHDREIVGCGFLTRSTGQLDAIFVDPELVRRGVGTSLLAALETIPREAGLESLALSSTLNAISFYKSVGFEAEGQSIYTLQSGLSLQCILMKKSLR